MRSLVSLSMASLLPGHAHASPDLNAPLAPRAEGEMDIHHIDTGRGNCTLILAPDGTSIMIDAGASAAPPETSGAPRPNASKRPGQWQALYARRYLAEAKLDYFVATHIHPDHIGDVSEHTPPAPGGWYRLTGVSDIDAALPIEVLIDRHFPDYTFATPPGAPFADNYLNYLRDRRTHGHRIQRAEVGSAYQIKLRDRERYPTFEARILSANGKVWNGDKHPSHFLSGYKEPVDPHADGPYKFPHSEHANENMYSISLRFAYGAFSYFTGGDLTNDTQDGHRPWMDIESPVARIAGRTEVAAADHHGYFDACGPEFVRALDAQVYILQAWDVGHPATLQLERLLGAWDGNATHDVFATDILPANELTNRRFTPLLKSRRGHIVVRVAPGGATYRVFVVDSSREDGNVVAAFGPYTSRT